MEPPHLAQGELAEPPPQPAPAPLKPRCSPADANVPCGFATLPDDVLLRVFGTLPADARAACARVCAPWREALVRGADAWRAWTRLDLSTGSGMTCTKSDAALAGATALARGRLQELDLDAFTTDVCTGEGDSITGITFAQVLRVLRGCMELRELVLSSGGEEDMLGLELDDLQKLIAAVPPTLQRLDVNDVTCRSSASSCVPLLRAVPPYGPLRMRSLTINCHPPPHDAGAAAAARQFAAAVAHSRLRNLMFVGFEWKEPAALEALADALLARTCRVR